MFGEESQLQKITDEVVAGKEFVVDLPKAEALNKAANETTMRLIGSASITAAPEGGFVGLHDVDRLAEWIAPDRKLSVQELPRELWDSRLALLLVLVLLTAEWIGRKKYNLA